MDDGVWLHVPKPPWSEVVFAVWIENSGPIVGVTEPVFHTAIFNFSQLFICLSSFRGPLTNCGFHIARIARIPR